MIPFSCPPVFVPSDSDGEGERHPADESSEVWHDRRHGHADAPERGLGAVQPAQTLLCLDDLREYPVMERRYFPHPMFPCSLKRHHYPDEVTQFKPEQCEPVTLYVVWQCCVSSSDVLRALLCDDESVQMASRLHLPCGRRLQRQTPLWGAAAHLLHRRQCIQRHAEQWVHYKIL